MDSIIREYPFELRTAEGGDGLTLEGYATVFDSPTRIAGGWEGDFTETVARGAFKKTISERTPILMFNHGKHPLIGDLPIGAFTTLREDDHGLFVRARLADNWLVQPVRDAIKNGSVKGMSFRFSVPDGKDSWNSDKTQRTLREVMMPECGPVVFPAYGDTEVSVRSEMSEALSLLAKPEVRENLAVWLMREHTDLSALAEEAVREDTSDAEQPAPAQEPAPTTPVASTRRERLDAIARLKGITE